MITDKQNDYILISSDENTYKDFYQNFEEKHADLQENHLIIELSDKFNIVEKDILLFLKYSELHQQNGTTFVIVYSNVDIDELPDSFNVVPTLQEAEDVLEMENIERDLGF